jgi:hypothetical protein
MTAIRTEPRKSGLFLTATARHQCRSRFPIRVIDISTHRCRIEVLSGSILEEPIWLTIANLGPQLCRVAWSVGDFAEAIFERPLSPPVLEGLLTSGTSDPNATVAELRNLAARTRDLALRNCAQADLLQLSRDCAIGGLVLGLQAATKVALSSGSPRLTGAMVRREPEFCGSEPGFSFSASFSSSRGRVDKLHSGAVSELAVSAACQRRG